MHHGATYIHTRNKAGDTRQHHGSGKQVSWTFKATAPTLGVVSPAPSHATSTHAAGLARGGGGRGQGEGGMHASYWGKGGQWWQEKQASLSPMPVVLSSHTVDPCSRRRKGALCPPSHPRPQPGSLVPSGGGPTFVPMVWGVLECLGNQGRPGLRTGGGTESRGCTQTSDHTGTGEGRGGWVGAGAGGSAGVPGSWQGQGAGRGQDRQS